MENIINEDETNGERAKKSSYSLVTAWFCLWELRGSNPRPSACKADALNQLS